MRCSWRETRPSSARRAATIPHAHAPLSPLSHERPAASHARLPCDPPPSSPVGSASVAPRLVWLIRRLSRPDHAHRKARAVAQWARHPLQLPIGCQRWHTFGAGIGTWSVPAADGAPSYDHDSSNNGRRRYVPFLPALCRHWHWYAQGLRRLAAVRSVPHEG